MNSPMNVNVIKGFEKLTPQQVFDISLKHVRTTRKQCLVDKACLAHVDAVPKNNASLINDIQYCHDEWVPSYNPIFMDYFNRRMEEVALRYSLIYTPENV